MIEVIEKDKAVATLNKYFGMLQTMGYVKPIATKRFLVYMFIVDFVEKIYEFLDEADYNFLRDALLKLFTTGCCLMPYKVFVDQRKKVFTAGSAYIRTFSVRVTESDAWYRITENKKYRTV